MKLSKDSFDEQNSSSVLDEIYKGIYKECRDIEKEKQPVEFVETANSIVNGPKNRYADVLPIKNTAVKLTPIEGIEDSDYINANYVYDSINNDLEKKQLYIACQAPPACTFNDFWRMIWEQSVPVIIMITNLIEKNRIKADPYWPACIGQVERFGDVLVKLTKEQQQSNGIVMRTFHIWQSKKISIENGVDSSGDKWTPNQNWRDSSDTMPSVSKSVSNSFETKSEILNTLSSSTTATTTTNTTASTSSSFGKASSCKSSLLSSAEKIMQQEKKRMGLVGDGIISDSKTYFDIKIDQQDKKTEESCSKNLFSKFSESKEIFQDCLNDDIELANDDDLNYSESYSEDEENEIEDIPEVGEVREVVQLHCTNWPDFGIPDSSIEMSRLIHIMDIYKKSEEQPIVVHCSAGIGRTGTFVAIHMCLHRAHLGLHYDIKEIIKHLRTQRIGMVQSKEQYSFVYSVTKDMLNEEKKWN